MQVYTKHKIGDIINVTMNYDNSGHYLILDIKPDGFKFQDDITIPTYLTLHLDSGMLLEKLAMVLDKYEKIP